MHIVIEYYVYVSVCVRVQLGETVTWIYLGSSSWTAMVPRFNVLTSTLDLRILEDMWYAKHCSSTVSGKAACVQVIKRYQKTVGLLIVQDGFSWCFSWCLQPLNVDSCQFYDPLFSLSLSFSNHFLFLTNSLPEMPWLSNQLPAWHTQCEDHFIQEAIEWKAQGVHIQGCHCISNVRWCPDCFLTGRARIWPV